MLSGEELEQIKEAIKQEINEHSDNEYKQLEALGDAELVDVRYKERALKGSLFTIPFFSANGAPAASGGVLGTVVLASKQINSRFSIYEIQATFGSSFSDDLEINFLVSDDNDTTKATGLNILSEYSSTPFLTGDSSVIKLKCDPQEFPDGKYLKIYAVNSGSSALTVDAKITIKTYPLGAKADE